MPYFALSEPEVRVLGCLIEKQRTTPDVYPLSLNSLRLACNQSTAREPVVDYDDALIRDALHRLERRGLVRLASGAGSRAAKYRHLLADALPMDAAEQALLCVLMLRGAQTPGELKQRAERMHPFAELGEVHGTLRALIDRGLAERLERRPGQKEERYRQLLAGDAEAGPGGAAPAVTPAAVAFGRETAPEPATHAAETPHGGPAASTTAPAHANGGSTLAERVARLEREVELLRRALREIVAEGSAAE